MRGNNWYKNLNKSRLNPPSYVFKWVWPALYLLMAAALAIVWTNKKCYPYCSPLTYFFIQLILNLSWTTVFFQLQMPILSFIMIILIIVITGYTAIRFYTYSKIASYLLIPYLLWLFVALSLNGYIILNN